MPWDFSPEQQTSCRQTSVLFFFFASFWERAVIVFGLVYVFFGRGGLGEASTGSGV